MEGLVSFAGLSTPLRWGETVPLYFALHALAHSRQHPPTPTSSTPPSSSPPPTPLRFLDCASEFFPPVVILSQPRLGLTPEARATFRPLVPSLLISLGRDLRSFIESLPHRTVLIVSGDLAHTHAWPEGMGEEFLPDPSSTNVFPREGRAEAAVYDEEVGRWMTGGKGGEGVWELEEEGIARRAGGVEEKAISCGWTGLLTMQGVMEKESICMEGKGVGAGQTDWVLSDFCLQRPTYYAMACALFSRNEGRMEMTKAHAVGTT